MTVTIIYNKRPKTDKSLRTLMLLYDGPVGTQPFAVVQPNGDRELYDRDEIKTLGPEYDKAASEAVKGGRGTYFLRAK